MVASENASNQSRVLGLFAELLEYPRVGLAESARDCSTLTAAESEEAASLLGDFAAFVERTPRAMLEEIFTATFDLNATCHPYIGYHMFGEDYRRSAFLLELKGKFREFDFDTGIELPDHISVMLRFMSLQPNSELATELVRDAILPTLEPMTAGPEAEAAEGDDELPAVFDVGDDYRKVLHALRLVLHARYGPPSEVQHIPIPDPERLVS